jgi:ATP synthase protein I
VTQERDERPPLAVAMEWTSRITTISLEMAVPGLIGYWLDQRLVGRGFVFLVLGVIVGFVTGLMSLLRLTRPPKNNDKDAD